MLNKEIFVKAAEILTESHSYDRYACNALKAATGTGVFVENHEYASAFLRLFMAPEDKLKNSPNTGLYGDANIEQNQLARTLALLLAGEILGGTDGNVL